MFSIRVIFAITFLLLGASELQRLAAQDVQPTIFYVVRHADRDGSNDALTAAGKERAEQLAVLMKTLRVNAIYSTDTRRTQMTAKPTADSLSLSVQSYGKLTDAWFDELKTKHAGQVVLIVGHSNTSGQIVNGLGGQGDFSLEEDEYENLFIVTAKADSVSALRIRFGEPDE